MSALVQSADPIEASASFRDRPSRGRQPEKLFEVGRRVNGHSRFPARALPLSSDLPGQFVPHWPSPLFPRASRARSPRENGPEAPSRSTGRGPGRCPRRRETHPLVTTLVAGATGPPRSVSDEASDVLGRGDSRRRRHRLPVPDPDSRVLKDSGLASHNHAERKDTMDLRLTGKSTIITGGSGGNRPRVSSSALPKRARISSSRHGMRPRARRWRTPRKTSPAT